MGSLSAPLVAVARDKYAKGFDGTGRDAPAVYEVVELREALERVYTTDAHLVTYVVRGAEWQPRVNKLGLGHFDAAVETHAFFCDVDNAGHADWNDELLATAMHEYATLEVLSTAGIYHTTHGRRIVQPIAEPILTQRVEPYLRRWLRDLEKAGLAVDWACRDWTRHFRLPNVVRKGKPFAAPLLSLERMVPIRLPTIPEAELPVLDTPKAPRPVRGAAAVEWASDIAPLWRPRVEQIAAAVKQAEGNWHELFLAIAGSILSKQVPGEQIPAICRAISLATCADTRTEDRLTAARSTVERALAGVPVAGHTTLRRRWPAVAQAVDAATASKHQAKLRAHAASAPKPSDRSLEEIIAALQEVIRTAPDGLTLIQAECGLGKTAAVRVVAKERSEKTYSVVKASGKRAPNQSKTAISVDKNALAIQVTRDLREAGATVRRVFGPLSVLRADGTPECRLFQTARHLVEGGQSVQREFCQGRGREKCEFYEQCTARDGSEGPANARIIVGPHALLSQLNVAAGSTGLLVIDEPPPLLETETVTLADFDAALTGLGYFDAKYADAMRPALRALRAWTESVAPLKESKTFADTLAATVGHIPPAEFHLARNAAGVKDKEGVDAVLACVAGALPEDVQGSAPPIQRLKVFMARKIEDLAKAIGAASRVLRVIHSALTAEGRVALRVMEKDDLRVLLVTRMREDLVDAVTRDGAVVVADANVDLHAPLLAKVVGYEPKLHRFAAADGSHIDRVMLCNSSATRTNWLPKGRLVMDTGIPEAVSKIIAWAKEDPTARELGIITFRPLAMTLRAALRSDDQLDDPAWEAAIKDYDDLAKAREVLAPILASWPGTIYIGHYGALRGLDHMKDLDALATLGDPWPNLDEVEHDVAFLGLEQTWEPRAEAMCRAELEQAHGRLRTVHRRRRGRASHTGRVLPGGSGWRDVEIRQDVGGQRPNVAAMTVAELARIVEKLGGIRATARALGCGVSTVHRFVSAERAVPKDVAQELRAIVATALRADAA